MVALYIRIYTCLYTQHSEDVRKTAASHSAWRPLSRNLPAEARTLVAHRGRRIPFGPLRASLRASLRAAGVGRAAPHADTPLQWRVGTRRKPQRCICSATGAGRRRRRPADTRCSGTWAHPCHICPGAGLVPATSARCHICTGTGLAVATSAPGLVGQGTREEEPWIASPMSAHFEAAGRSASPVAAVLRVGYGRSIRPLGPQPPVSPSGTRGCSRPIRPPQGYSRSAGAKRRSRWNQRRSQAVCTRAAHGHQRRTQPWRLQPRP
jgi:hypothetical protein